MKKNYLTILFICAILISNAQEEEYLWAVQMGDTGDAERSMSITTDASGNVYTTGTFNGTVDFDPGTGVHNLSNPGTIFIQKLDQDGNFLWAKQTQGGFGIGRSITTDANGNIYITGNYSGTVDFDPSTSIQNSTSVGNRQDIFIQKLDTDGNFLWAKQMGGLADGDIGYSITTDASGNVYTTGAFTRTVDFDPGVGEQNITSLGLSDIFIQKLDTDGNFLWAKQIGGAGSQIATSNATDSNGNIYTTGSFNSTVDFDPSAGVQSFTAQGTDIFIQKLSGNGSFIWAKHIKGEGLKSVNDLTIDRNGNIYTTGDFWNTVDFDPGPGVVNLTPIGNSDIFIQKLNSEGNFLWAKHMGSVGFFNKGRSITTDNDADIYTTGDFWNTVDFDPGSGIQNLTSAAFSQDIFIQKLDPNGNFIWAKKMGGIRIDRCLSITSDTRGNIFTTGTFERTVDFDPDEGIQNFTSNGNRDIFIQKLGQNTTLGVSENGPDPKYYFYPNPTSGQFNVSFESVLTEIKLDIIDVHGRIIDSYIYQNTKNLNLDFNYNAGIYFIKIETPKGKITTSFIKK